MVEEPASGVPRQRQTRTTNGRAERGRAVLPRRRLLLLDTLRLFAAAAVMLYHYTAIDYAPWATSSRQVFPVLSNVTAYGFMGVQLFFVISGFVILMSAWGRSVGQFAASRISRLYPAYWTGVLLTGFLIVVLAKGTFKDVSVPQILVNLTMMQKAVGVSHVDGVYWTLWVELLFYMLIGILLSIGITYGRVLVFIFLWPVVAALADRADSTFLVSLLVPQYAPLFAMGMALFLVHRYGHSFIRWAGVGFNLALAATLGAQGQLQNASNHTQEELSPVVFGAVLAILVGLVALCTVTPFRYRGFAWMSIAGALTYPFYLVHEYWGWWVISLVGDQFGPVFTILVAACLSLTLAWLIHRFVERPSARSLRKAVERGLMAPAEPAKF